MLFSLLHEVVATDHYEWHRTLVEALTKEEARDFFNKQLLPKHGIWWRQQPITVKDVRRPEIFKVPKSWRRKQKRLATLSKLIEGNDKETV